MVRVTASALDIAEMKCSISSTGVIGQYLPMDKVAAGIPVAVEQLGADGTPAAEAIRTTDTFAKEAAVQFVHDGGTR